MKPLADNLTLLNNSFLYIRKYYKVLISLGLIASLGRVAQLGGFGEIPTWLNVVLEIVIELSRVAMIVFVIGATNIKKIVPFFRDLIAGKLSPKVYWKNVAKMFRINWRNVTLSFLGFALIALVMNLFIDHIAYQTCLLISLKARGILAATASEWTILLFFKNISVIPFTLVFEALLIVWMTTAKFQHN